MATATQAILHHSQPHGAAESEPKQYAVLFNHNGSGYRLPDGKTLKDFPRPYGLPVVPAEYRMSLREAKSRFERETGHGARTNTTGIFYDCEQQRIVMAEKLYR